MPLLGEIKTAGELGEDVNITRCKGRRFIWNACEVCGKERWSLLCKGKPRRTRCFNCSLKKKGGALDHGYRLIYLKRDDFFRSMVHSKTGYIYEQRLVMAKYLNRLLQPWESVHHRNGVRLDNRIENLSLVMKGVHNGKVKCPFCHKEFVIR